MGNRAVVVFGEGDNAPAVYLHWNGGRESVQAFIDYLNDKGVRADDYAVARFAQVVGNYFGGTYSLGAGTASYYGDQGDNGVYVVGAHPTKNNLAILSWSREEDAEEFDEEYRKGVYEGVAEANDPFFEKGA